MEYRVASLSLLVFIYDPINPADFEKLLTFDWDRFPAPAICQILFQNLSLQLETSNWTKKTFILFLEKRVE